MAALSGKTAGGGIGVVIALTRYFVFGISPTTAPQVGWLTRGYRSGDPTQCETFAGR